jgi:hypothetical protein
VVVPYPLACPLPPEDGCVSILSVSELHISGPFHNSTNLSFDVHGCWLVIFMTDFSFAEGNHKIFVLLMGF